MIEHAYQYVTALAWGGAVTWQTFDDGSEKQRNLAQVFHGTLSDNLGRLQSLNERGAGIFVTVNETDQRGRKAANVKRIRALFTDDDGGGSDAWPVEPSFLVHSAGGVHAYWLIHGSEGLDGFSDAQKRLALHLSTDDKVHDTPRVMRCPGFYHQKRESVMVTFEPRETTARYTIEEVVGDLPQLPKPRVRRRNFQQEPISSGAWWQRLSRPIVSGSRNAELFRLACAMRGKGMTEAEMASAVSELNQRLCSEPLDDSEVASIVQSAGRY